MPSLPPEDRARLLKQATSASVTIAATLMLAKFAAWYVTGSVAVLASLVDSLMDTAASVLTLIAVRFALKPADDDHRFGHGKSEALAGLAQAVFITASTIFVVVHAISRLRHPEPLTSIPVGLAVMTLSVVATLGLVIFQRRVVRATGSAAIAADSLHYFSDIATNASTILALALASYGFTQLDPLFAMAIAALTFYGALHIAVNTFQVLMDRELPVEIQERIREIALGHREILGIHDLRTHHSGATKMIQLHLEMDGRISLNDAHRIADEVEAAIREVYPEADVVTHQDPAGIVEPKSFE